MFFRHVVGKSTLKEGITIHKDFEAFFASPEPGNKREITLLFDDGQSSTVTLRRLNNARQHVQLKYESKSHLPLLNWLNEVFEGTRLGIATGEILEFTKITDDVFRINPITYKQDAKKNLYLARAEYYKSADIVKTDVFNEGLFATRMMFLSVITISPF